MLNASHKWRQNSIYNWNVQNIAGEGPRGNKEPLAGWTRPKTAKAVARLNEAEYDAAAAFEATDIYHHDLELDDRTCLPNHIVAAYFAAGGGAIDGGEAATLHFKAGLTGMLITMYRLRAWSFGRGRCWAGCISCGRPLRLGGARLYGGG
jgi:hypothetical protein